VAAKTSTERLGTYCPILYTSSISTGTAGFGYK
jgi:hypothetical protein